MSAAAPELIIGSKVAIETQFDERITGTLFAFDLSTDTMVLRQGSKRIVLKTRFIRSVQVKERGSGSTLETLPALNKRKAQQREQRAIEDAQFRERTLGKGVSQQTQLLFDSFARM